MFRAWAGRTFDGLIVELNSIDDQAQFDEFLSRQFADLGQHWFGMSNRHIQFGSGRKLLNLLLKSIPRYTAIAEPRRSTIKRLLHVAFNEFTLAALRLTAHSGQFSPPVEIPRGAKMGWISSPDLYESLQEVARKVAADAGVPDLH